MEFTIHAITCATDKCSTSDIVFNNDTISFLNSVWVFRFQPSTLNKKPKDFADNLERDNADEGGPSSCVHSELIYGLGLDQDKKAFHSSILTELMSDIFQIRIWNPFPDP